jgi:Ca2+/Na+ antiporter
MDNLNFLCKYKERWFISYLIGVIIIFIVLSIVNLPPMLEKNATFLYFLCHVYIVIFYKSKECKIYKFNKLKRELE